MIYNKSQVRKLNDKKILHKVGKHWTVVSIALLGLIGGASALATNVQADTTTQLNNQPKQQIKQNIANSANNSKPTVNNIQQQAKQLHTSVVAQNTLYTKSAQPSSKNNNNSSVATNQASNSSQKNNFLPQSNKVSQNNQSANITNISSNHIQSGVNKLQSNSLVRNSSIISSSNQSLNNTNNNSKNVTNTVNSNENNNQTSNTSNQKLNTPNNKINGIKKVGVNQNNTTDTLQVSTMDIGNAVDNDDKKKNKSQEKVDTPIKVTYSDASDIGNVDGLNYISDGNGDVDFINGTANNQWRIADNYSKPLSDIKSVTFNSDVNFSNVSNMSNAFGNLPNLQVADLSNLDTGNVSDMTNLFESDYNLQNIDLHGLNTENVNSLQSAFKNDSQLSSVNLGGWNTSNVSDIGGIFSDDQQLAFLNLSDWDTSHFNNAAGFFNYDNHLYQINLNNTNFANLSTKLRNEYYKGSNYDTDTNNSDHSPSYQSDTPKVLKNGNMYKIGNGTPVGLMDGKAHSAIYSNNSNDQSPAVHSVNLFFSDIYNQDDKSNIAPKSAISYNNSPYYHLKSSDIPYGYALVNSDGNIINNQTPKESIQDGSCHIKVAPIDNGITYKYNANTGTVRFMNGVANDAWNDNEGIEGINVNNIKSISFSPNVDFSNVTNMNGMFKGLNSLQNIDLRNLDTSNVTDMGSLFSDDPALKDIDLDGVDTSKVSSMNGMFKNDSDLQSINLNNLNTHNVSDMEQMFRADKNLTNVELSALDTTNLNDMYAMFQSDSNLQHLSLAGLDLRNVNTMDSLFIHDTALSDIDFSNTQFNSNDNPNLSGFLESDNSLNTLNITNTNLPQIMNKMHGTGNFNLGNSYDAPTWLSDAFTIGNDGLATSRKGTNLIDGNAHPGIWHPQSNVILPSASTNSYATNSDINNINNSLNSLSSSVASNSTSNNSTSVAVNSLSNSTNSDVNNVNNSLKNLSDSVASNSTSNNSNSTAINSLSNSANNNTNSANIRMSNNEANINSLSNAVNSLSGLANSLNGDIKANSNNLDGLNKLRNDLNTDNQNLTNKFNNLNGNLNSDSQNLKDSITDLHNAVESKADKTKLASDMYHVKQLLLLKANEKDVVQDFNDLINATDSNNRKQNVSTIGKEANKFVDIMNSHLSSDVESLALSKADKKLVNDNYNILNNDKANKEKINNKVDQEIQRLQNLIGRKGNNSDINNLYQNYNNLNNQLKRDDNDLKYLKRNRASKSLIQKLRNSIAQLNRYMRKENANQRTALVRSGYLMPRQTMHLYSNLNDVGTAQKSIATISPNGNNTMHILKTIHNNHGLRFLVNFNGQRAYVTGDLGYVQNAYLDTNVNYHGQRVFVKRPLLLHKHARNETDNLGRVKPWRVLTINRVINVSTYKHNRMTRIQLTNGKWITANKNFISLV